MRSQDPSSDADDQFAIEVTDFVVEPIPGTSIKLLRARPETEPELSRKLSIPRRLELLRRSANHTSKPHPYHTLIPQDADQPVSGGASFLQDVAVVGTTSNAQTVYLVLSVLVAQRSWTGGWCLAVVASGDTEQFKKYLASACETIVAQLREGEVP
jgi:hypothetical protein